MLGTPISVGNLLELAQFAGKRSSAAAMSSRTHMSLVVQSRIISGLSPAASAPAEWLIPSLEFLSMTL